jgi:hypothetical protein
MKNKLKIAEEVSLILSQEMDKFRLSKADNKYSDQQIEYVMKRLSERIINETFEPMYRNRIEDFSNKIQQELFNNG